MALLQSCPPRPEDQLAGCELFKGLSSEQRASIASLITQRLVEPGASLVREGDTAAELIVIQQGSVEVTKRVAEADRDQRIATLREGATLGEMTLVDRAPRSATVRAIARTRVGILSMDRLERLAATDPDLEKQMLRNLANDLARRLRFTNETTVAALEQQLELERMRSVMARFVVFLAFMMVSYTFALQLATAFLPRTVTISVVSFPLILLYAAAFYRMLRRSGAPFESFGLTMRDWRPVSREALLWSIPMCALATLMKLGLLEWNASFAGQRLFNLAGILDPRTSWPEVQASLFLAFLYAAAVPLQEFIVRVGLQRSLHRCQEGPHATTWAIVTSNALFASSHLHLSLAFAAFAFVPGLVWGALYARQGNIVGVSVSHILCGWFVFLVLGFEPWY